MAEVARSPRPVLPAVAEFVAIHDQRRVGPLRRQHGRLRRVPFEAMFEVMVDAPGHLMPAPLAVQRVMDAVPPGQQGHNENDQGQAKPAAQLDCVAFHA